jgi:hypothetical protein
MLHPRASHCSIASFSHLNFSNGLQDELHPRTLPKSMAQVMHSTM